MESLALMALAYIVFKLSLIHYIAAKAGGASEKAAARYTTTDAFVFSILLLAGAVSGFLDLLVLLRELDLIDLRDK